MSYFTAVRLYSLFELCLFTALLVAAIGGFSEDAELVLGWSHGIGWILLCIAVASGAGARCSPGRCWRPPSRPRDRWGARPGWSTLPASAPTRRSRRLMFPLNLPNVLTLLRILLVPVLVVALTEEIPNGATIAAAVFVLAALTDGLDGYIARSRQSITTFGKVMDPIADKLLIAAALLSLVSLDRVAAWVAMVIIAREFAVSGLRIAAGQQGVVIPASALGKIKTIVQSAAVLALIAAPGPGRRLGAGRSSTRWCSPPWSRAPTTS